jgi:succinoglycan biosynthesis protein ExoM
MKILIGIPSYRRPDKLGALLRSLQQLSDVDALTIEVFVADNDGQGQAAHVLCQSHAPTWRWPLSSAVVERRGISAARNRILEEAQRRCADLVAMVDDDELVSPEWLAKLIEAHGQFGAQVIGGPVLYEFERPAGAALLASGAFPLKRRATGIVLFVNATGNILLECAALARLGWPRFSEQFGTSGGEDKEFLTRLKKGGLAFAWADDAIVCESVPAARMETSAVVARAFAIGNADYRIDARHAPARARVSHVAKSTAVLLTSPLLLPGMINSAFRLKALRRFGRSAGKLAAAFGRASEHYSEPV